MIHLDPRGRKYVGSSVCKLHATLLSNSIQDMINNKYLSISQKLIVYFVGYRWVQARYIGTYGSPMHLHGVFLGVENNGQKDKHKHGRDHNLDTIFGN